MNNDLSRILAQLAATAPALTPAPLPLPSQAPQPPQQQSQDPRLQQQQQQRFALAYPAAQGNVAPAPAPVPEAKPDPRGIKDYPAAVRYITKFLARDEEVMGRIAKMRERQREHERMWWQQRQELVHRLKSREASGKRLQTLLSNLGTAPPPASAAASEELPSEAEELAAYDRKVHMRCQEMADHMTVELGQLGVPLFCEGSGSVVGEAELGEMRRRVVEFLEDLCGE